MKTKTEGFQHDQVVSTPAETSSITDAVKHHEVLFHGVPSSPGISIGRVYFLKSQLADLTPRDKITFLPEMQVKFELDKLQNAVKIAEGQIDDLKEKMESAGKKEEAAIFSAQKMFLTDTSFIAPITNFIRGKHYSLDDAVRATVAELSAAFSMFEDSYFKERINDIKDVAVRILRCANGADDNHQMIEPLPPDSILMAENILPSDVARFDLNAIRGIVVKYGSKTCHAAILARSLEIPALTGMSSILNSAHNGDEILIDGYMGMAILYPIPETLEYYKGKMDRKTQIRRKLLDDVSKPILTTDGVPFELEANLASVDDCAYALRNNASSVGLFRTEFLYLNSVSIPDEESQYRVYCDILHAMNGRPVTIRTFDFGGDKANPVCNFKEDNPFLGMRAIRLHKEMPDLLRTQLSALLRAGMEGDLRVMFPMVTTMHEIDDILSLKKDIINQLEFRRIPHNPNIKIGVMIEIPSAAIMAEDFAEKVDFFSIGTNDLVQYTLAVDRLNDKVQHLYKPCHPSVLRLIKHITDAAKRYNIDVAVCGEMAGNPLFALILLGLGVKHLSMVPGSMPEVSGLIRRISLADAELLAQNALKSHYTEPIVASLRDYIRINAPDIFALLN